MLLTEFPLVTTGNMYTAIDTYSSTITTQPPINVPSNPNAAQNPIGAVYVLPQNNQVFNGSPGILYGAKGWGGLVVVRYVRYNSTTNAALLSAPAPVYWTDETYTTVSGTFSEGNPASTGNMNSFAGYILVNSTSLNVTGAAGATALNGNFCFLVTRGFIPNAYVPASTAVGDSLTGTAGNFTLTRTASGTAPISLRCAIAQSAIASGVADVLVNTEISF